MSESVEVVRVPAWSALSWMLGLVLWTSGAIAQTSPVAAPSAPAQAPIVPVEAPAQAPAKPVEAPAQASAPAAKPAETPLKLSGYIQAQYTHSQESKVGLKDATTPNNLDKFEIRRGRIKVVYAPRLTELVLQIDATTTSVALRDAEASLVVPLPPENHLKVTVGLFKLPTSYDAQLSSNKRWFPERSQLSQRFFPGERDVGARVAGDVADGAFNYALAVVNGQTISEKSFPGLDPNPEKDVTAHLGIERGPVSAGIAGYYGTGYVAPAGDDAETDASEAHDGIDYRRFLVGSDLRVTFEMPRLGTFDAYGELAFARNMARAKSSDLPEVALNASGDATNQVEDREQLAWYIALTQRIGSYVGTAFRAEQFSLDLSDPEKLTTVVEPALLGFITDYLWLSFAYAHRSEQAALDNDQVWVRLQAKYASP